MMAANAYKKKLFWFGKVLIEITSPAQGGTGTTGMERVEKDIGNFDKMTISENVGIHTVRLCGLGQLEGSWFEASLCHFQGHNL